ncbi:MAG TPA: hypothetical protein VIN03_28160 [Roseateles sp.]
MSRQAAETAEAVFFGTAFCGAGPIFTAMSRRYRRPLPLPSFGPRRLSVAEGSMRLVMDERWTPEERPVQAELLRLERFSALMAAQGWPAHVSRMAYDRIYAGERFGFAKRVGRGELPGLARELIQTWRASRNAAVEG